MGTTMIPDDILLNWLLEYLELHSHKNERICMELFSRADIKITGDSNEHSKQ